ncbi:hypothetical protein R1T16_06505 [Flavobacterium sp. DG1-102-2]|uniref:hypothetical protein n=1 Tax=Flavobacterium sp. DG1-102-2 TaxID=3081663 RepID=UPI00294A2D7C|nr:hypothetical protein [Flavobacterium sp. DG1-102-2]MDV6168069.1 hypothetical protein [Flavobacterium sp. DG1-102-2]
MSIKQKVLLKYWYKYTNYQKYQEIKNGLKTDSKLEAYNKHFSPVIDAINESIANKKVLNFKHSGHLGDIVYSFPVIKELAKTHACNLYIASDIPIHVKNYYKHPAGKVMLNSKLISKLLPLLKKQEYLSTAAVWGGQEIDIDLDLFRDLPVDFSFLSHRWYFHIVGIQPDLNIPYLEVDEHPVIKDKVVIVRSFRARNYFVDYSFLAKYDNLLFIGIQEEYEDLKAVVPNLEFYDVKDFYEMAQIIKSSRFFLGNQSFAYAVADGLKVPRLLEANPPFPVVYPLGENSYDFYFQQHFETFFDTLYNR